MDLTTKQKPETTVKNFNHNEYMLQQKQKFLSNPKYEIEIIWLNVILFILFHIFALNGLYRMFTSARIYTTIFAFILYRVGLFGVTAGSHRLWAHKSYKAKWPLRMLLTFYVTLAFLGPSIEWARDHRIHHKFSETDADPYNSKRGFFFCHIGWLMCKKHPDVIEKGRMTDLSDLYADPVLVFQKKYYWILMPLMCFLMPTLISMYFWNETFMNALMVAGYLRWAVAMHSVFLINSVAHMYGNKPYDKNIAPAQNKLVSLLTIGEGWHNFHHTFPWDYRAAELGSLSLNATQFWLDVFAKIGWAYDLKTAPNDLIESVMKNRGDKTVESTHLEVPYKSH